MKNFIRIIAALLILCMMPVFSSCFIERDRKQAAIPFEDLPLENTGKVETEDLASRFLIFSEEAQKNFGDRMSAALIAGFNSVYPNLVETWCHGVYKDVIYIPNLDTDVAYTTSGSHSLEKEVDINYKYLTAINEVDAVTHELTHVCQDYIDAKYGDPMSAEGGSWIVEGMTDYSRYMFGIYPGGFALPAYSDNSSYTDSYRVTARFFLWLDQNVLPTFTEEFNEYLRSSSYRSSMFSDLTGYTLDELWQMYSDDSGRIKGPSGSKTSGSITR